MARFIEEVKTAVQASACAVLSANEFVNGAVGLVSPASRDFFNGYVNSTRKLIGCVGPDNELPIGENVAGQCVGVSYSVTYQNFDSGQPFGAPVTFLINGAYELRKTVTGGSQAFEFYSNGNFVRQTISGPVSSDPNTVITASSREDGLPDDCGQQDPVFPPPTNITNNIEVTYQNDEGDTLNVSLPFVFAPIQVNFDGSLRVPFTFDFGGVTFDGTLNLEPEINVDINLPRLPRGEGQNLPTDTTDDDVDPAPLEEKIIGVVVTSAITRQGNITEITTTGMPNIFAPRLGSIKFAYSLGAATFWSNDIDLKGLRVFIPCPFSQGADAVVATPVPGISLSTVAIRGYPLATTDDIS